MSEIPGSAAAEAVLLQAGLAGDRDALDQLLALHERRLLALCHGMLGHAEDAEDAVQETFFRALRALPRFRRDASFRTWLLRIAVNVCLNWKRDRRRDPTCRRTPHGSISDLSRSRDYSAPQRGHLWLPREDTLECG